MAKNRREQSSNRRAWMPIAAGLALLGMLGSGGLRVDIWAHLCGLLIGAVLGIAVGYVRRVHRGVASSGFSEVLQWAS